MYSKARIAGHPIHPLLIVFPIALFTSTIVLLLAFLGARDPFYYRAAMIANIAGVVSALVAVIPGAIDLFALPGRSRARATGMKHALLNILTIALFAVSGALLYLDWTATIPLAIGVVGFVAMVSAAALGYTLVQTHHVGIKPAFIRTERSSRAPELALYDDYATPTFGNTAMHH